MECNFRDLFASNLRRRRIELGMTQEALGELLNYSGKSVSKWESGKSVPNIEILPMLASLLKTDINTLMSCGSEHKYFLGIDGGATKTKFALADEQGCIIRTQTLGPCNPVDSKIERTLEILDEGIREICCGISYENISVFAGIAGVITGKNQKVVSAFLKGFDFAHFKNDSDVKNAIALGLGTSDGIAVIMGTGCILYAVKDGHEHRIGGYGYLFDEGGSGYDIGCSCIRAALQADDGSGGITGKDERSSEELLESHDWDIRAAVESCSENLDTK